MKEGRPVLIALPMDDDIQVIAWCPYCEVWHTHGMGGSVPKNGLGHRVAHCHSQDPESPFEHGGYYLRVVTKPVAKKIVKGLQRYIKSKSTDYGRLVGKNGTCGQGCAYLSKDSSRCKIYGGLEEDLPEKSSREKRYKVDKRCIRDSRERIKNLYLEQK